MSHTDPNGIDFALQTRALDHASNLAMFRSVIFAGAIAILALLTINGIGAMAAIYVIGVIASCDASGCGAIDAVDTLTALAAFLSGLLGAAMLAGATYLAQLCYASEVKRLEIVFHATAIVLGLVSAVLFWLGYRSIELALTSIAGAI